MADPIRNRSDLRPVLDAFPEHRERLRALLGSDPDLDDLCDDYDAVVDAYRRATSGEVSLVGAADEYHRLKVELEVAILDWIADSR